MGKSRRRVVSLLVIGGLSVVATPANAFADQFKNKDEARAANDPAGSAPSFQMPETFKFRGGKIKADEAKKQGLTCEQDADGVTCAEHAKTAATSSNRDNTKRPKARVAATAQCSSLGSLQLFQYAQVQACYFTDSGWRLTLVGRQAWYDMGTYSDGASAYYMGDHSGHMSDYYGGGGYWIPYATGVGDAKISLNGTGWSNRISSRYRN